jgi:glucose uptake protein GlcU
MKKTKKSPKKLAKTTIKEDTGKLLLDLGKLVFGSFFLGSILRGEIPHVMLVIVGFAMAIVLFIVGIRLVAKEKKNGDSDSPPAKQE